MAIFDKLLLAVDLTEDADQLLSRVLKVCANEMEKVHVLHVLRSGIEDDFSAANDSNLFAIDAGKYQLRDQTFVKLKSLLFRNSFDIADSQIHIKSGEPAYEIKRLAHELSVDLVIVGSHCRQGGWLSLPGATTNCVLQGIDSDVMAVRV